MGNAEKRELVSRLAVLLAHLPTARCGDHLADNPSLRARLGESVEDAYKRARLAASSETGVDADIFPAASPWAFEDMMAVDFRPDSASSDGPHEGGP